MDEVLARLEETDVNSKIIRDLIDGHVYERERMIDLYQRYKTANVPIQHRKFEDSNKINRKINNDYFSEIVDTKIGYFAGNPVSYQVDKSKFKVDDILDETLYEKQIDVIEHWKRINHIEDLDSETAKMAAICGKAARLNYVDGEGELRTVPVDPWECIFINDGSTGETQYAMRYYRVYVQDGNKMRQAWKVEWYDDARVMFYIEDRKGNFAIDSSESRNPMLHMFGGVPLVEFPNNEERMGDAENVLELIDAYDRTLSDANSEIEQFRLAYMVFYGVEPDEEMIQMAKKTGGFFFDSSQGGEKAEFLTKNFDDKVLENHLDRLDKSIYKFSKTPNFTDEGFSGSQSGEARKYKMLAFESKCITTERKFTAALQKQFKLLNTLWVAKYSSQFDWEDISLEFSRNFPLDLEHEGDATSKLRGHISERTRLSLLSFVDDVDKELELIRREREDMLPDLEPLIDEDEDDE